MVYNNEMTKILNRQRIHLSASLSRLIRGSMQNVELLSLERTVAVAVKSRDKMASVAVTETSEIRGVKNSGQELSSTTVYHLVNCGCQ